MNSMERLQILSDTCVDNFTDAYQAKMHIVRNIQGKNYWLKKENKKLQKAMGIDDTPKKQNIQAKKPKSRGAYSK